MLNRRDILRGMLQGAPLVAMAANVPQFLTRTALAAADTTANKEKILVVVELAGGNDGLNMLVPYGDELYYKARPTIAIGKNSVMRIDDHMGLNPAMAQFEKMFSDGRLTFVQGVGYPNPIRSHFESMDIWHTADPTRRSRSGWLGQTINAMPVRDGKIPALNFGGDELPLALQGGAAVPTVNPSHVFGLEIGEHDGELPAATAKPKFIGANRSAGANHGKSTAGPKPFPRKNKIRELTADTPAAVGSLTDFVRRTALDSYSAADRMKQIVSEITDRQDFETLAGRLFAVSRMIRADFGTRIFFVSLGSFDTHSDQLRQQGGLLNQLATAINNFFVTLAADGNADRVLLMTFSEFGRRVEENGDGTDHGSASTMILAGGGVKGGLVGQPPRLDDLADGDIKFQIDFRRVYATMLEDWLTCDSRRVLGDSWQKLPLFAKT